MQITKQEDNSYRVQAIQLSTRLMLDFVYLAYKAWEKETFQTLCIVIGGANDNGKKEQK